MPIIVLAGDEDFELYRSLKRHKEKLLDPQWASFNFARITRPGLQDIADNALAVPFGPGNKVIVFEDCDLFTKKKTKADKSAGDSQSKQNKQLEHLDDALASVHQNTYLLFACPANFDKSLKTSKIMAKHATIEEFARPKFYVGSPNPQLETWCRKEAKQHGVTIDDRAISYLLDGTEADLRQIASEIEKAAVHILPKTHITYDLVVELSPHHDHVFALLDHFLAGRGQEAFASVDELLSRQPAIKILATIQTFLSRWVEMKAVVEDTHSHLPGGPGIKKRELPLPEQAKRIHSVMKIHPFVAEKDLKRLAKWNSRRLLEKKEQLTDLEHKVKTGRLKDISALQLFLAG